MEWLTKVLPVSFAYNYFFCSFLLCQTSLLSCSIIMHKPNHIKVYTIVHTEVTIILLILRLLRIWTDITIDPLHSQMLQTATTNTNLYITLFLFINDSRFFTFGTFILKKKWWADDAISMHNQLYPLYKKVYTLKYSGELIQCLQCRIVSTVNQLTKYK